jgi:hypothetical protein
LDFAIVSFAALFASALAFFSGFGLGTLLLPVFALFYPVEVAVAATAVVHGANNALKIAVVGKHANRDLVLRFGLPAIAAAFAGAALLGYVAGFGEWIEYQVGARTAMVTPVKLAMGILMLVFGLFELLPRFHALTFERKYLALGGVLSGFFGGFSGHQGALRSAFLVKTRISTQAFVGTNAVIGFLVDMARIATYAALFLSGGTRSPIGREQWPLVLAGVLAAFAGVLVAKNLLPKITMSAVRTLTGILLLVIALALGSGIL